MNTPENLLAFRHAALLANIRTIGCEFDGSGDSGSVNAIGLVRQKDALCSHKDLEELIPTISECYVDSGRRYDYILKKVLETPEVAQLTSLAHEHEISLESLCYDVLDHFPGDWVNDAGGYGNAFLDLASGAYHIDGYQRYESQDTADASGTFFDTTLPASHPVDATADYIKNLLA